MSIYRGSEACDLSLRTVPLIGVPLIGGDCKDVVNAVYDTRSDYNILAARTAKCVPRTFEQIQSLGEAELSYLAYNNANVLRRMIISVSAHI